MKNHLVRLFLIVALVQNLGCSAVVGSDMWCEVMKEKSEGDWSFNEAKAYAKHCIFDD